MQGLFAAAAPMGAAFVVFEVAGAEETRYSGAALHGRSSVDAQAAVLAADAPVEHAPSKGEAAD